MSKRATRGNNAQFTYDFGIAIAQSTVNKITRLTGASLTLASAFYALKSTSEQYISTLRENTLRFGGVLSTMKAMEQAQNRLIKGQSYFSVDDQLKGMNELMAAGIKVGKNLDWINKAAHATGKSFAEFSGMISSAIQGNTQALVDAGLMTQRATRMFDKYAANTVMRQQAILNFVKTHKGLMNAIKNDFETIQDQMMRLKAIWQGFLMSILGKPNDPGSFYGQIVSSMRMVADALAKNMEDIRRYGWVIGQVLGWVMKQIGHFVVWIGRQAKKGLQTVWRMTDDYVERTRSMLVWLEFWKLKIVDLFKEYGGAIKTVIKLLLMYKALKTAFVIGRVAIMSVIAYYKALKGIVNLQMAYMALMGPGFSKTARFFQSLAVWMPRPFRQAWVASGKWLGLTFSNCTAFGRSVQGLFTQIGIWMVAPFKMLGKVIPGLLKLAFGGIGVLTAGPLGLLFGKGAKGIHFKKLFLTFKAMFVGGFKQIVAGIGLVLAPIWNIVKGIFGPVFKFLSGGFKNIINVVLNLPKFVGAAFNAIKGMWAAINATNPVGWVILAVTAITLLYVKFKIVRVIVNNMFKAWWEWLKLLWNIVYGAFIGVAVLIKKCWNFLSDYIFKPIANFFKWAWKGIKNMWAAFKDTSVGRFINKWIVKPLENLFNWIMKALRWLLKGAATILSVINKSLAEEIRKGEKELGMTHSLAADGGNYDANDDTNYLNPKTWFGKDKKDSDLPKSLGGNPLLSNNTPSADIGGSTGGSGGSSTNLTFGSGAIQIIVEKGQNIDEQKLARKVKEVINDMRREGDLRGGRA